MIDPDMPQEIKEQIRKDALEIFHAVDGFGCARVDFFLKNPEELYLMRSIRCLDLHPSACIRCSGKPVELTLLS